LLGTSALGEVAADDDELRFQRIDLALDGFDEILVMGAEVKVGKMDEASHGA
jgi:hypothetical protein